MKCDKCKLDFEEEDLELSHDVPRWIGGVDLDGRHWLCKKCHRIYEWVVIKHIWIFIEDKERVKESVKSLSKKYFKTGEDDTNTRQT